MQTKTSLSFLQLDLSGVDRDKVSGQASAEIRPLKPQTPYTGLVHIKFSTALASASLYYR